MLPVYIFLWQSERGQLSRDLWCHVLPKENVLLTAQKLNLLVHPIPTNPIFHYVLCFLVEHNSLTCSLTEVVSAKQFTSKNANKGDKQCFTAGLHGFCCFAQFLLKSVFRRWPQPAVTASKDKKLNTVRFSNGTDLAVHSKVSSPISDPILIRTDREQSIH